MRRLWCAGSTIALVIAAGMVLGQDKQAGKPAAGPAVNPEILKLLAGLEACFDRGDAKGLAACWTPNGEFVGPAGERIQGRDNIEKVFGDHFAARKSAKLKLRVTSVRLLGEDAALVEASPEVTPPPPGVAGEPSSLLVLAKRGGRWLIDSARETTLRTTPGTQCLKDLAWLVGDWAADETGAKTGVSLHSTCDWTANHAFLIRKFKAEGPNIPPRAGTEVIGWDPRTRRIRSWDFDSNGSFGESVWLRDGDRWLIKYSGTLPDGGDVSATHVVTLVDADTVTLQSKDRTLNGRPETEEVPPITIKRQAAADGAAKTAAPKKPPQHILP